MLTVVTESESTPAAPDVAAAPVVQASGQAATVGGSLIDEIVRDGARRMLAAALEAEVAAYIEAHADRLDEHGHRLVVRNGRAEPRQVLTAAGAVEVVAPRVNDKRVDEATGQRHRYASVILPAWCRKSPKVTVVTYDPHTSYQHPDHIHTARVTAHACEITGVARKLYFKAHGSTYWADLRAALNRVGIARPAPDATLLAQMQAVQQRTIIITTTVDAGAVVDRKRQALLAHRSQLGSSAAATLPPELFAEVFGVETYIRAHDTTGAPTPEHDLFAGLL